MAITFLCANARCGRTVTAPSALAGQRAKCPYCGLVQQVPPRDLVELEPIELDPGPAPPRLVRNRYSPVRSSSPAAPGSAPRARSDGPAQAPAELVCPECGSPCAPGAITCPMCGRKCGALAGPTGPASGDAKPAHSDDHAPRLSDYVMAIFVSLGNLRVLGTMAVVAWVVSLVGYVLSMLMGGLGALLFMALAWMVLGYFLSAFRDAVVVALEGGHENPPVPDFKLRGTLEMGLRGLGLMFVYVFPIVTLPLLPLGMLGLGCTLDYRAYDLRWAMQAARRVGWRLLVVWVCLLGWAAMLLAFDVCLVYMVRAVVAASMGWFVPTGLAVVVAALLNAIAVATVGNAAFRCAGLLGRHRPEIVDAISDDEQPTVGKRCLYVCFAVSVAILLGLLPLVAGRLG